jgi:hypothetical protein
VNNNHGTNFDNDIKYLAAKTSSRNLKHFLENFNIYYQRNKMYIKNAVFWDVVPCRSFGLNRRFGGMYRLHLQNMEATRSPETSVQSTRSTRRHIPEDGFLHSHRRENLKSYKMYIFHVAFSCKNSILYIELKLSCRYWSVYSNDNSYDKNKYDVDLRELIGRKSF